MVDTLPDICQFVLADGRCKQFGPRSGPIEQNVGPDLDPSCLTL